MVGLKNGGTEDCRRLLAYYGLTIVTEGALVRLKNRYIGTPETRVGLEAVALCQG